MFGCKVIYLIICATLQKRNKIESLLKRLTAGDLQ